MVVTTLQIGNIPEPYNLKPHNLTLMKIIIAGAGAVGTHLARLLAREKHEITLLDESSAKLDG